MHFRWLEVGQLVAREPSLVALMLHRSPHSYLSLCPGYHHLQKPFRGQAEETSIQSLFLVFKINSLLSANVSRCCSQVSVAVRMQLVAFTVLSSTLLLLAVIHSVYLQPGMGLSVCFIFLQCVHFSIFCSEPACVSS